MMTLTKSITLLTFGIVNILLHTSGSYVLILHQRKQRVDSPRDLFLVNLGISEVLKNLLYLLSNTLMGLMQVQNIKPVICNLVWNMNLIYFCSMFIVTTDRLLAALLNLKYRIYSTYAKGKRVIISQWILGAILAGISIKFNWFSEFKPFNCKLMVLLSSFYLFYAIITYCIIFKKFIRSKQATQLTNVKINVLKRFRQSKFYVSVLLITSFVTFIILPDILVFFFMKSSLTPQVKLLDVWIFVRQISDTCDWCIYIFAKDATRKLFLKKICCYFYKNSKIENRSSEIKTVRIINSSN